MSRYALWEAARDLMQGRRLDTRGQTHGWVQGRFHLGGGNGSAPRECLNGALALAEAQLTGEYPVEYNALQTRDGIAVRHALACTIRELYGDALREIGAPAQGDDPVDIAVFNDQIVPQHGGQAAMDAVLDETEARLFEEWLSSEEIAWPDLIEEADRLDQLLPLA